MRQQHLIFHWGLCTFKSTAFSSWALARELSKAVTNVHSGWTPLIHIPDTWLQGSKQDWEAPVNQAGIANRLLILLVKCSICCTWSWSGCHMIHLRSFRPCFDLVSIHIPRHPLSSYTRFTYYPHFTVYFDGRKVWSSGGAAEKRTNQETRPYINLEMCCTGICILDKLDEAWLDDVSGMFPCSLWNHHSHIYVCCQHQKQECSWVEAP